MPLIEAPEGTVRAAWERLLPADVPTRLRAIAVLDGVLSGRVWVDALDRPSRLIVLEDADGTVYVGGDPDVAATLEGVTTRSGDLIFGFAGTDDDDPLRAAVPGEPYWRGAAIDFIDRRPEGDETAAVERALAALPDGVRAVPIDARLLSRTEWYEDTLHAFGSLERWQERAVGFGIVDGDALLAECVAGPRTAGGWLEMGVATREAHRRRGYGTLLSRLVARACESRGDRVWWNANADNAPSIAIARRIGFRSERRYDLVALRAPIGSANQGA
jgi:RimJ/RimL family protein N-acetyltransferase